MGSLQLLLWTYVLLSLALLFAVRRFQVQALYLLKSAWVGFTVIAFVWVLMMSGATNDEFAHRPAGFFTVLSDYPAAFARLFGLQLWWLSLAALLPAWLARTALGRQRVWRRLVSGLVVLLGLVTIAPLVLLASEFDWSTYRHFAVNYGHAWKVARMGDYLLNSVLVSASAVGLVSVVGSMAAYALSRVRFTGHRWVYGSILAAMAIPGALLLVPLFLMMQGWAFGAFSFPNSRLGLSVIYAALSLPFTVFLLSAFYRSLPEELAQAAVVDGASPWRVFSGVYFPLSVSGLATTAIFNFLAVWNEYHFALVFLTNPRYRTLPVGLYNLQVSQQFAVNWPVLFAGVVILILPTFLIFVLLQDRIVAGLTVGGVKV